MHGELQNLVLAHLLQSINASGNRAEGTPDVTSRIITHYLHILAYGEQAHNHWGTKQARYTALPRDLRDVTWLCNTTKVSKSSSDAHQLQVCLPTLYITDGCSCVYPSSNYISCRIFVAPMGSSSRHNSIMACALIPSGFCHPATTRHMYMLQTYLGIALRAVWETVEWNTGMTFGLKNVT